VIAPLLAAALLASSPTPELTLAAPGWSAVNLSEKEANFFSDHFAQQLTLQGLRVYTASELQALIGLERQRQLLACVQSACTAELGNAVGARGLVTGSVGKFGTALQVNIKVLDVNGSQPLGVHSKRVEGEGALLEELTRAATAMAPELKRQLRGKGSAVAQAATGGSPSSEVIAEVVIRCRESCTVQVDRKAGEREGDRTWKFKAVPVGRRRIEATGMLSRPLYTGFVELPAAPRLEGYLDGQGYRFATPSSAAPVAPGAPAASEGNGFTPPAPSPAGTPAATADSSTINVRCAQPCTVTVDGARRGNSGTNHVLTGIAPGTRQVAVSFMLTGSARAAVEVPSASEVFLMAASGKLTVTSTKPR
jgi:hypothetical protein